MKIKQTLLLFALLVGIGGFLLSPTVSAAVGDPCGKVSLKAGESCCGGVVTSIISCTNNGGPHVEDSGLWSVLLLAINILTAGVGVAAVGGIIFGSILYTTASGKPEQVKKANVVIANTVLGIIIYAVAYSFMNFLIPGGLFN